MFLHPSMLAAGLAGAAIPLILHLLSRARYRTVDWGAMAFFGGGPAAERHAERLKRWLLLALRMATVGLLGAALARPSFGPSSSSGPRAAVILLDHAASMGLDENGRSRLDLARQAVFEILSTFNKQDQLALIVVGDGPPRELAPLGADPQEIERRVTELAPVPGRADLAAGLRAAADRLAASGASQRQIFVVCDHQAAAWSGADEAFMDQWRRRFAADEPRPQLFVVPVGSDEAANVAIESVDLVDAPAIVDLPAEIEVKLHNYGPITRSAVGLRLSANVPLAPSGDSARQTRASVRLDPDSSASVRFPVVFANPGSLVVSADIRAGGLAFDKHFDLAVEVGVPVSVLVITGAEDMAAPAGPASYLRLALAPFHSLHPERRDPADVTVVRLSEWTDLNLDDYQVLILSDVGRLTDDQARALEQFVYEGGGLMIAPGESTSIDNYNAALWRDGQGILPGRLQGPGIEEPGGATALGDLDATHPIFRFLAGRPDPGPPAAVRQFIQVAARPDGARVLGRYADGAPFLLESSAGRGRVLLLTTTLDTAWNDLPLTSFYLPFVQSAVRDLARWRAGRRNLLPGEPLTIDLQEAEERPTVELLLPDGRAAAATAIHLVHLGARWHLQYDLTRQPGVYRLLVSDHPGGTRPRTVNFVVRPAADASDVVSLSPAQWRNLTTGLSMTRLDPGAESFKSRLVGARSARELWLALLGAVIVLSLAELAAGRLFTSTGGGDA